MVPREELLPNRPAGFRLLLRDPIGLAEWLSATMQQRRDDSDRVRPTIGRPSKFDLVQVERATGVSRSTLSKLLAPERRRRARSQRYITVGVLRGLSSLSGDNKCLDFVFSPRDQDRLGRYELSISNPLSEQEAALLEAWLASPIASDLRDFAKRATAGGFSRQEVVEWLRWVMAPFVNLGIKSAVNRSWDELTPREQRSYASGALRLIDRILSRRSPAKFRIVDASEGIDWHETLDTIADLFGVPPTEGRFDSKERRRPLTGSRRRAK